MGLSAQELIVVHQSDFPKLHPGCVGRRWALARVEEFSGGWVVAPAVTGSGAMRCHECVSCVPFFRVLFFAFCGFNTSVKCVSM